LGPRGAASPVAAALPRRALPIVSAHLPPTHNPHTTCALLVVALAIPRLLFSLLNLPARAAGDVHDVGARGVALQVAFERQTLKPVFHFIGYRL
jgi:hypothetical protein